MNRENKEIADMLRQEVKKLQSDRLIRLESERKLEQRLQVGRQRIREVINQLVSEGLLIKYEGKGTYIAPLIRNKFINLICSPSIKLNDPFYNRMLMELTSCAAKNSVNIIPLTMDSLENGERNSPILLIGKFEEHMLQRIKALYRKNGFIRGAGKNGLEYVILESKMNFRGGYALAEQVKELVKQQKFTAVFAANDWMAVGLIQALRAEEMAVPDQVSVLSVDNIPLAGQFAPGLTTYSLDAEMMITEGFMLMDTAEENGGEENFRRRIILQPVLITRDTLKKREGVQQ